MSNRCNTCGTYGKYDFKNQFISDDWIRASTLHQRVEELEHQLSALTKRAEAAEARIAEAEGQKPVSCACGSEAANRNCQYAAMPFRYYYAAPIPFPDTAELVRKGKIELLKEMIESLRGTDGASYWADDLQKILTSLEDAAIRARNTKEKGHD